MSYDVDFKVKVEGIDKYISVYDCPANVTWNVREIIVRSTGLPWNNEKNNGLCVDVIPKISKGYWSLVHSPKKFKKYEPDDGWGTVEGTAKFFKEILDSWNEFVRYNDEEIVNVTTFWIE